MSCARNRRVETTNRELEGAGRPGFLVLRSPQASSMSHEQYDHNMPTNHGLFLGHACLQQYVHSMTSNPVATVSAPLYAFSPTEHSAIIVVATVVSSMLMLAMFAVKLSLTRNLSTQYSLVSFDTVLYLAAVVSVIQTIVTVYAGHLGLGNQAHTLDHDAIARIRQV